MLDILSFLQRIHTENQTRTFLIFPKTCQIQMYQKNVIEMKRKSKTPQRTSVNMIFDLLALLDW